MQESIVSSSFVPNAAPEALVADLPPAWHARLVANAFALQTIGCSDAAVFRAEAVDGTACFVKTEPLDPLGELPGEVQRLRWLAAQGVECPRVLDETQWRQRHWLLMSALPGNDLASSSGLPSQRIVDLTADALRDLHRLDVSACPFDQRSGQRIADARARVQADRVDATDFDDDHLGWTPQQLFETLLLQRPRHEDLVVTHGDACLPNLMAADGRFSGFIDCGRLGVADRHQDLALAARSIGSNLGDDWVAPFLRRYGGEIDAERLAFYRLLDEFF